MASKIKAAQKEEGKDEAPEKEAAEAPDAPLPLLDLSDAAVKKMIKHRQEARLRHPRPAQRGAAVRGGHLRADRGHSARCSTRWASTSSRPRRPSDDDEKEGEDEEAEARAASWSRSSRRRSRQGRDQGADRAHRRSGPHVSARNGLGRTALARGRNRHRQAHRGRPRGDDRRAVRKPADLPGHHHLARRTERGQGLPARHHRSRSDLCRPRRQGVAPAVSRSGRPAARRPRGASVSGLAQTPAPPRGARRRDPVQGRRRRAHADGEGKRRGRGRGRFRRRRHGEFAVARRDRGRAQAEGGRDLRQRRRRLQEAAPPAGPGHRVQAQEHDAVARAGAPLQEAQGRDHRRGEVAAPQPGAHRFAGRAALRHQQAPRRLRGPPDAARREPWRRPRGLPASNYQGSELDPHWLHRVSKLSAKGWKNLVAKDKDRIKDHRARRSTRWRPRPGSRSASSARSCRWCRRASAKPARPRRRWSRPTCASSSRSPRSTPTAACSSST